jgi:hypothetical protein
VDSIQDESKALNVWHIKDAKTIYINWVKGSIPEWTEKHIQSQNIIFFGEIISWRSMEL